MLEYLSYYQYDLHSKRVIGGGMIEANSDVVDGVLQNTGQVISRIESIPHPSCVAIYIYDQGTFINQDFANDPFLSKLIAYFEVGVNSGFDGVRIALGNYRVYEKAV